jgi:hypothetical protein
MDLLNKKRLIIISLVILLFVGLIVFLFVMDERSKQTDIDKQTAEIYDGPPRTTLSGEGATDLYELTTDLEYAYIQYALGDFYHNTLQQNELQNTITIISSSQSYESNNDVVNFSFKQDKKGSDELYSAKIIRPLTGDSEVIFRVENKDFEVILSKYKYII